MKILVSLIVIFPLSVFAQTGIEQTGNPATPYTVTPPAPSPLTFTNLDDAVEYLQSISSGPATPGVWAITVFDPATGVTTTTNLCSDVGSGGTIRPCQPGEVSVQ